MALSRQLLLRCVRRGGLAALLTGAGFWAGRHAVAPADSASVTVAAGPSPGEVATPIAIEVSSGQAVEASAPTEPPASADQPTKPTEPANGAAVAKARFERAQALPLGPARNREMIEALTELAGLDGVYALEAAKGIEEIKLRHDAVESVIERMGRENPDQAWQLLSGTPNDGSLPSDRIGVMLHGLAQGDAQEALDFLWSHHDDLAPHGGEVEGTLDEIYRNGGHDVLKTWAEALPAGKTRDIAVNRIIDQWARYDPAAAKAWMESQPIPAASLPAARIELAESWARVRPQAAIEWVQSLPAQEQSRPLYDSVFRQWMEFDRNGAAQWLASQSPSPLLDRPIERYTWQVMEIDPQNSMPWAESITDGERRFRAMTEVADRWGRRDPQGLISYVGAANLPPQQKERLLRNTQVRK